jgi:hypothetical protein
MLSNAIWIMPTADRSAAVGTATIYFRCGSQSGKAASTVSSETTEVDFASRTADFIAGEIEIYRRATAKKQKNSARNLKKYFDAAQIAIIDRDIAEHSNAEIAAALL